MEGANLTAETEGRLIVHFEVRSYIQALMIDEAARKMVQNYSCSKGCMDAI